MTLAMSASFFRPGNAILPLGITAFGSLQICGEIGVVPHQCRPRRLPSCCRNIWTNSFRACRRCGRITPTSVGPTLSLPVCGVMAGRAFGEHFFSCSRVAVGLRWKDAKGAGSHKRQAEHLRELHSGFLRKKGRGARPASLRTESTAGNSLAQDLKRAAGLPTSLPHTSLTPPNSSTSLRRSFARS